MSEENKLIDIKGRAFLMNNGSDSVSIEVTEEEVIKPYLFINLQVINNSSIIDIVDSIHTEKDFHEVLGKYQKLADAIAHVGNGIVQFGQKNFPNVFEQNQTEQPVEVTAEEEEYVETLKPTTIPLYPN